jgi:hypothetical protein
MNPIKHSNSLFNIFLWNFHTNSKPIILKIYTVTLVKFDFNEISGTQAMRDKEDLAKLNCIKPL